MVMAAKLAPQRAAAQELARVPMPVGGLNYNLSTLEMGPNDAYLLDNFIPRPYGLEIRGGWRFWVPEENALPGKVRTVMTYNTHRPDFSKIFVSIDSADSAVYDVTSPNTAAVVSFTPSTPPIKAGEWHYTEYVTPGGSFLCVVAYGAGYYIASTDSLGLLTWTEVAVGTNPGQLKFPDNDTTSIKELTYCWSWQNRLWFLKHNSATAYYLPVGQITGTLAAFDFGPQLVRGGALNWGTRWTYDSGQGMDDSLLLVSLEGDALLYEGTDPSNADKFKLKGVWYLGRSPVGKRNFCQHGGDLLVINEYGIVKVSDLVAGRIHTSNISGDIGIKVNPRLSGIVSSTIEDDFWFMLPIPAQELLFVGTPWYNETRGILQSFIMNSITNAWATVSNMGALDGDVYKGRFIFGTREGYVCEGFVGHQDNVPADGSSTGSEVTARLQAAFLDYGKPTLNKRLLRTKQYGQVDVDPSMYVTFKSEYNLNELVSTPAPVSIDLPSWDNALWDEAIWNANTGSLRRWIGVAAYGKKLSLQLAARGSARTVLTDYEVTYEVGLGL